MTKYFGHSSSSKFHDPLLRNCIFFLSSRRCTCPSDQICVQDHDDIAILAYIYRCRSAADAKGLDVLKEEVDTDGTSLLSSNSGSSGSP